MVGVFLIVLGSALGALISFPYGWLVGSGLGIIGLFVGMRLQRIALVKTFSRTFASNNNIVLSSHVDNKVIKAAEERDV